MNLKSLVVIILRLMALNFLSLMAIQTVPQALNMIGIYKQLGPEGSLGVVPWFLVGGLLLSAILLWLLALPIARFVTRSVPPDLTFGALSLVDCYTVAFIVFGLYHVCTCLADVLNWGHYILKAVANSPGTSWKEQVDFYKMNQVFLPFLMGIVLLIYGRSWAVMLARRQENARPPPINEKPASAAAG